MKKPLSFYQPTMQIPDTTSGFDISNSLLIPGFRKPGDAFGDKPLMQNLYDTQKFSQSVEPLKAQKAEEDIRRNQFRGNMLMALGDALRGKDISSGFLQRQQSFQQQAEKRIAEANQQNLTSNALTIAKANGATDAQLAIIAEDPAIARSVVQSSFNKPQRKIIKGVDGRNYYEDTRERVLPEVPDKPKEKTKNDFVVDILTKIQADPTYGSVDNPFTESDQRILDTISNTDPFDIYKREINQKINSRDPKTEIVTEPAIVTTQEQFDALPSGSEYIEEDGITYRKP